MTNPPRPAWLPAPVPFHGDWDAFIRTLYAIFEADFKANAPRFRGRPVWHGRRTDPGDPYGFEEGFWHLVSRDEWVPNPQTRKNEKQRLPEIDRAARLPWARPTVEHETAPEVLAWEFEQITSRGRAVRCYLWLRDWDYVVILEKQAKGKGDIFMLVTTFLVDLPGKRKDLESRYEKRLK